MSSTGYLGKEKRGTSAVVHRTQILKDLAISTAHLVSAVFQFKCPDHLSQLAKPVIMFTWYSVRLTLELLFSLMRFMGCL